MTLWTRLLASTARVIGHPLVDRAINPVLWALMALALSMIGYVLVKLPAHYKAIGRAECQAAVNAKSAQTVAQATSQVIDQAKQDISRAQQSGTAFERAHTRIQRHFNALEERAAHEAPSPVDQCELPAARLRLWKSANDGRGHDTAADQGATAPEPDGSAPAAASAPVWPHAGPGSQPPQGGTGVPRTRGAALRATEIPGVSPQ
jgi:hypothetical protein